MHTVTIQYTVFEYLFEYDVILDMEKSSVRILNNCTYSEESLFQKSVTRSRYCELEPLFWDEGRTYRRTVFVNLFTDRRALDPNADVVTIFCCSVSLLIIHVCMYVC